MAPTAAADENKAAPAAVVFSPGAVPLPKPRTWTRGWNGAMVVSAVLHGLLLAAALLVWTHPFGGGGTRLDAIEIEVVDTGVLESASKSGQQGGGDETPTETTGRAGRETSAATTVATAAAPTEPPLATAVPPLDSTTPDMAAAAKPALAPPAPPESPPTPAPPITTAGAPPTEVGGAVAVAVAAMTPQAAAAAASPGDVLRFQADVAKALRKKVQTGKWPRGRVLLAFSVSVTGKVENATLMEPSADARLNQIVLAWIAAIPMPVPPAGLTAAQRRYSIPLQIK